MELDQEKLKNFLLEQGVNKFNCKKIAGDASFRSYYRIKIEDFSRVVVTADFVNYLMKCNNLILMFAPPKHEDVRPFMQIGELLLENNLSAPKMFGFDDENGFLLLEDFGDESYNKSMKKVGLIGGLEHEEFLYKNAIDALVKAQEAKNLPKDLKKYNHGMLFSEVKLFVDWYLKFEKKVEFDLQQMKQFKDLFFRLFDRLNWQDQVLVLRDYHADNLMCLSGKSGVESVGLLDFQDAVIGSSAYDLVSLVEDARRDVDLDLAKKLVDYYLERKKSLDGDQFRQDYKILSLQRNLKILGIFSRLARRDNKEFYLSLLPRVKDHVVRRLQSDDDLFGGIKNFLGDLV